MPTEPRDLVKKYQQGALLALLIACPPHVAVAENSTDRCDGPGLRVQVLGSGGDLAEGRAASAYLVWVDGKARALVDFGAGAALRFAESRARTADLDVVLLSRVHASHTLDLPMLVSLATRENRTHPLPLYGPTGNRLAPSAVTFARTLLDSTRGAYRHLGEALNPMTKGGFKLDPHDVRARPNAVSARRNGASGLIEVRAGERLRATATYVGQSGYPVLAWRISVGERAAVFSGDTDGDGGTLERLTQKADLLIAHHPATAGGADGVPQAPIPASVIGRIAAESDVKRIVLTHRTHQTLGREAAALAAIRTRYGGPVVFADDLNCFAVP